MLASSQSQWQVDSRDPRAPPMTIWEQMSESDRHRLVEALAIAPHEELDAIPPEGTRHDEEVGEATDRLRSWFGAGGRQAFVARDLRVYYPNESPFEPDVLVVLDVPQTHRDTWIVAQEGGRGLDVVIEVAWKGSRNKDLVDNVVRFARLGIREYYVVDLKRGRFHAYHLPAAGGPYQIVQPVANRVRSVLLDLDLWFDGRALRFVHGITSISSSREGYGQLQLAMAALSSELSEEKDRADHEEARAEQEKARAEQEKARAEQEKARAEQERARADDLARQVADLIRARGSS